MQPEGYCTVCATQRACDWWTAGAGGQLDAVGLCRVMLLVQGAIPTSAVGCLRCGPSLAGCGGVAGYGRACTEYYFQLWCSPSTSTLTYVPYIWLTVWGGQVGFRLVCLVLAVGVP